MMKRLKKMISIVMAVIVIATGFTVPVSASSGYTDVSTSDSCYNAVIYLRDHNIMVGQTSTYFGKNGNLIRADVVSILWRMLNMPEPYGMISSFPDCDPNAYYYKAVQWACSQSVGIASGYENGNFGPTDLVSNQDLLTFIYRFACYCGYEDDNSTNRANYLTYFNRSALTNKNTFWNYSKVPVGWAYHNGFITNYGIQGTAFATRGVTAEYIYYFYKNFQEKYGLIVINSEKLPKSVDYKTMIVDLFDYYNIECNVEDKIEKVDFHDIMYDVFDDANKLDLCYLYISAHGREMVPGIELFQGYENDPDSYLTPGSLRSEIENYDGTFIVFLETCYSGNFILNSMNMTDLEIPEAELSAEAMNFIQVFVNELVGIQQDDSDATVLDYNLTGSKRIKVLGASRYFEVSQADDTAATYAWCMGAGRGLPPGGMRRLYADEYYGNLDGRTSLEEIYDFSYVSMNENTATSLPVRYPENDNYILFENRF